MRTLYVALQDKDSRAWVPVAKLVEHGRGYELNYTMGARRVPGFAGLGRMSNLAATYYSESLFPFFANRIISKSRPEYARFLAWLGLDTMKGDDFDVLSVTAAQRQTDQLELISNPTVIGSTLTLDFFPKGLRYLDPLSLELIAKQKAGGACA